MSNTVDHISLRIALFATLLALVVITLGAYTRLKDAGLGCPDWPGCYGQLIVPQQKHEQQAAQQLYPAQPIEAQKAWTEMVHRYVAGLLLILIFVLAGRAITRRNIPNQPVKLPFIILAIVIFQALLGMWTVTLRLFPPVVMLHLAGGFLLFSLLAVLAFRLAKQHSDAVASEEKSRLFLPLVKLALLILALQILLGGWTSANYAALVCPDFPFCKNNLLPLVNFQHAFAWLPLGLNYEGGALNNAARMAIHMTHRVGALITFLYIGGLSLWVMMQCESRQLFQISKWILLLLFFQVSLGVMNVILQLPLPVAVGHNAVAALLLVGVVLMHEMLQSLREGKNK